MAMSDFFNPLEEVETSEESQLDPEEALQDILSEQFGQNQDEEDDDDTIQTDRPVTIQAARTALRGFINFIEGSEELATGYLRGNRTFRRGPRGARRP
jgi:hypothetical protein